MWGLEHTAMATAFAGLAAWLIIGRNWSWLWAALLSQVTFWVACTPYLMGGPKYLIGLNLCLDVVAAGVFVDWGRKLGRQHCGGVVHIWLAVLFVIAASVDVIQLLYLLPFYVITQEGIHYTALLIIGGRAYVRGLDGTRRHSRYRGDIKSGGRVV